MEECGKSDVERDSACTKCAQWENSRIPHLEFQNLFEVAPHADPGPCHWILPKLESLRMVKLTSSIGDVVWKKREINGKKFQKDGRKSKLSM